MSVAGRRRNHAAAHLLRIRSPFSTFEDVEKRYTVPVDVNRLTFEVHVPEEAAKDMSVTAQCLQGVCRAEVAHNYDAAAQRAHRFDVLIDCAASGISVVSVNLRVHSGISFFAFDKQCGNMPLRGFSIADTRGNMVVHDGQVSLPYRPEESHVQVLPQEATTMFLVRLPPSWQRESVTFDVRAVPLLPTHRATPASPPARIRSPPPRPTWWRWTLTGRPWPPACRWSPRPATLRALRPVPLTSRRRPTNRCRCSCCTAVWPPATQRWC